MARASSSLRISTWVRSRGRCVGLRRRARPSPAAPCSASSRSLCARSDAGAGMRPCRAAGCADCRPASGWGTAAATGSCARGPDACARARQARRASGRRRCTLPVSFRSVPQMQLTSVLLPEPFGPIRPSRSPGCTSRSMPSSATKPPKRLPRPVDLQQRRSWLASRAGDPAPGRRCPFGATMTKATSSTPTISRLTRRGDRHGGDLLQRAEQDRADHRADPAGGAADQRHGDRVHRIGAG